MPVTHATNAERIIMETPEGGESLNLARKALERVPEDERHISAPRLLMAAAFRHAALTRPPAWLRPFIDDDTWNNMPPGVRKAAHRGSKAIRENILSWLREKRNQVGEKEKEDGEEEGRKQKNKQPEEKEQIQTHDDAHRPRGSGDSEPERKNGVLPPLP